MLTKKYKNKSCEIFFEHYKCKISFFYNNIFINFLLLIKTIIVIILNTSNKIYICLHHNINLFTDLKEKFVIATYNKITQHIILINPLQILLLICKMTRIFNGKNQNFKGFSEQQPIHL